MEYLSQEEKKIKREQIKKKWLRDSVLSYGSVGSVSSVEGVLEMQLLQSKLRCWREEGAKKIRGVKKVDDIVNSE